MEGWGNHPSYLLPANTRIPIHSGPSYTIISVLERRWMKGTTPQWWHFLLQTWINAFWLLRNCTWYSPVAFSFKYKTDCLSVGRGLLDKRHDKAGTVQPPGRYGTEERSSWKGPAWLVSPRLPFPTSKEDKFVCMCFRIQEKINFQWTEESNNSWTETHTSKETIVCLFVLRWAFTCRFYKETNFNEDPNVPLVSSSLHHTFISPSVCWPFFSPPLVPLDPAFFFLYLSLLCFCGAKWDIWTKAILDIKDKGSFFHPVNLKKDECLKCLKSAPTKSCIESRALNLFLRKKLARKIFKTYKVVSICFFCSFGFAKSQGCRIKKFPFSDDLHSVFHTPSSLTSSWVNLLDLLWTPKPEDKPMYCVFLSLNFLINLRTICL